MGADGIKNGGAETEKTRVFGIIGRPLGHSFSKGFFEAKFAAEGLDDCRFCKFELGSIDELPGLVAGVGERPEIRALTGLDSRFPELRGFSVTIPYKVAILPFLSSISDEAAAVGAVNCVRVEGGLLHGYNTDIHGFRVGLEPLLGAVRTDGRLEKPRALVLGTGGASRAVGYVLRQQGIEYQLVSRTSAPGVLTYADLAPEIVSAHRFIVNASPLGTWPDVDGKPDLPYGTIGDGHFLYDLVYNPAETAFLREGRLRGAATLNGLPMLHAQAEKAWEIWNLSL